MVVKGSQQKTLYLGFIKLGTQQQRVPVLFLRDLMLPEGFNPVSSSFTLFNKRIQLLENVIRTSGFKICGITLISTQVDSLLY
ncbi:unnamed protein product [Schistosoma margrebowiei]|uniref:Uncharacterized protein n=1 Tax=Schistosoma margrebowiei TaxID=48269 RepID=A0A183MCM4_9TREM|nr:unnamed protein product [Schistosoma margrebowiei]